MDRDVDGESRGHRDTCPVLPGGFQWSDPSNSNLWNTRGSALVRKGDEQSGPSPIVVAARSPRGSHPMLSLRPLSSLLALALFGCGGSETAPIELTSSASRVGETTRREVPIRMPAPPAAPAR